MTPRAEVNTGPTADEVARRSNHAVVSFSSAHIVAAATAGYDIVSGPTADQVVAGVAAK